MQTPHTSTHGGARPGAGRKPKPLSPSTSEMIATLSANPTALAQVQQRLTQALPDLLEALLSLAQGTTTTHERWVAAGTLTTGIGTHARLLLPQLPPAQLVLVGCDTYTHKPDTKALLFLLEHVLGQGTLQNQLPTSTTPPVPSDTLAQPTDLSEPEAAENITSPADTDAPAQHPRDLNEPLPQDPTATRSLRLHPLPPHALPLGLCPHTAPTRRLSTIPTPPDTAKALPIPASVLMW